MDRYSISFSGFPQPCAPSLLEAYTILAQKIVLYAVTHKQCNPSPQYPENEKYTAKSLCQSLALNGRQYQGIRKILGQNLRGDYGYLISSQKAEAKIRKQKEYQRKKEENAFIVLE